MRPHIHDAPASKRLTDQLTGDLASNMPDSRWPPHTSDRDLPHTAMAQMIAAFPPCVTRPARRSQDAACDLVLPTQTIGAVSVAIRQIEDA